MKKLLSAIYTVVIVVLLSGIASALPSAAESFPVAESASLLILGFALFGLAELNRKYSERS
ncbi:MAG: hypothetical protein V2I97_00535 [Desulfococcaceae bacterium]|jgi:hypothetical protein|nr:hypothetical protein [Desulfococcaceae bacterium]